ncbi:fungal-specific transcription factor domain-containing protein [Lactarius vividus]|nr:fungal-specific transcription factor domain-containing protein [Lactarius vividus]
MNHSSDEDNLLATTPPNPNSTKRRRVQNQRACDRCRQKKIRCGGTQSNSKCPHCLSSGADCIFTVSTKVRGPPKRFVDSLETRLEKMEGMISRLYPDGDLSQEMELDGWARGFHPENVTTEEQSPIANNADDPSSYPSLPAPETSESYSDDSEADAKYGTDDLLNSLRRLCIRPNPRRYFGKSSGISLMRTAMTVKSKASTGESTGVESGIHTQRRHEFWYLHPWELSRFQSARRRFDFPETDLLVDLIKLYFNVLAPMVPLLHQPTFMRAIGDGLHLRDEKFGSLVLLVCATASRYSRDPRVLLENGHWHSAGWKWFKQVEPFSCTVLSGPELYDLQVAALAVVYVHGSLPPQEGWIMVGVGLRLAQDVGAHRRRSPNARPTVEDELWKRAFWVLLMLDIWISSSLGRPCAMTEESHDVDLPIECDDEYWESSDPALAFRQPPGKPSKVSYFNYLIKINLLHSHALRTIYSLSKSTLMTGWRAREKGWEEHTVAELDSALNSWFDSIPDHLRWDPQREDETSFVQSASLRSAYYFIQITIHRPFIPSSGKGSSLSFAALAICASAARAYSHVADAMRKRYPIRTSPSIILPAFVSATILLLSLWGAKRSGTSLDPVREMQDVRKCIMLLETAEARWSVAGRLRDLLTDLTTAGNLTVPAASPPSNKREREDSDDESRQSVVTPFQHPHPSSPVTPSAYPEVLSVSADISQHRASTQLSSAAPPPSTPMSSTLVSAIPSDMFRAPSRAPPSAREKLLLPKPYQGGYVPLGGSSGLGTTAAIEPTTLAPPPPARVHTSFGTSSPLSAATGFATAPVMSGNSNGMSASEIGMILGSGGLYDMSASTSASTSATTPNSPQNGFHTAADFRYLPGTGIGGGAYDLRGMEFGGYGVPMADKEAMLRHFAPVLQDGQIGVDQDTMMMWSTMPSTYETQDWVTYMSNMLDLAQANVDPAAGPIGGVGTL